VATVSQHNSKVERSFACCGEGEGGVEIEEKNGREEGRENR